MNVHKLGFTAILFILNMTVSDLEGQVWSLQSCIDTATVHNRNLQIAENAITIADQKKKEVVASLLPRVSLVSDFRYFNELPAQLMPMSVFGGAEGVYKAVQFGVPYNIASSIHVSMPLYNPQVFSGLRTSGLAYEASQLQYDKSYEQMVYEITVLFYNIQITAYQLENTDSSIVNSAMLMEKVMLLNSQGLAKESDADRIRLQISRLETQRKQAETALGQLYSALKFAIGLPSGTSLKVDTEIKFYEPFSYPENQTTDVKLASLQVIFADNELRSARRSLLPVISAYSTYGQTGFGYNGKPEAFLDFYPVSFSGVQLSLPVFSGSAIKRKINQKKYESKSAEIRLEQVKDMNSMQVSDSRNKLGNYTLIVHTASEQVGLAIKIYKQVLIQHEQGTASLTDLLLADASLREARQGRLAAITDYLKAELELKRVTGNLLSSK